MCRTSRLLNFIRPQSVADKRRFENRVTRRYSDTAVRARVIDRFPETRFDTLCKYLTYNIFCVYQLVQDV